MYSNSIKAKVDAIFDELSKRTSSIVMGSSTSNEAITKATELISSELTTRSKSILSDMLFALSDKLLDTEFFADISKQNKFYRINLRHEILSKYQFAPSTAINYKEASRTVQALKVGGATLVVGGVAEIGVVLIAGLSISSLVPIPISVLIVASIGAAMTDYYAIAPKKNKKTLVQALDKYLVELKQQFLNWFDEVERYFNTRVEEIKQTM